MKMEKLTNFEEQASTLNKKLRHIAKEVLHYQIIQDKLIEKEELDEYEEAEFRHLQIQLKKLYTQENDIYAKILTMYRLSTESDEN